jgi:hypothetical protein
MLLGVLVLEIYLRESRDLELKVVQGSACAGRRSFRRLASWLLQLAASAQVTADSVSQTLAQSHQEVGIGIGTALLTVSTIMMLYLMCTSVGLRCRSWCALSPVRLSAIFVSSSQIREVLSLLSLTVWRTVVLIQTGIVELASVTARIAYIAVDATHAAAAEVYATLGVAFCMLEYTISMLSMSLRQAAVATSSMVRVLLDCLIYLPAKFALYFQPRSLLQQPTCAPTLPSDVVFTPCCANTFSHASRHVEAKVQIPCATARICQFTHHGFTRGLPWNIQSCLKTRWRPASISTSGWKAVHQKAKAAKHHLCDNLRSNLQVRKKFTRTSKAFRAKIAAKAADMKEKNTSRFQIGNAAQHAPNQSAKAFDWLPTMPLCHTGVAGKVQKVCGDQAKVFSERVLSTVAPLKAFAKSAAVIKKKLKKNILANRLQPANKLGKASAMRRKSSLSDDCGRALKRAYLSGTPLPLAVLRVAGSAHKRRQHRM